MNLMKNIFRMAIVAFAAIAVAACDSDDEPQGGGEVKNIVLEVDVENITATSAKIKVLHDGKTADSWYGLLTTEVTKREDLLIDEAVAQLATGDIGAQLIFSKNYTKIISPLSPETTYKYIAFGLTEEGVVYGERASVEFTTLTSGGGYPENPEDEVYDNMLPNPAWSVAYTGAKTIDGTEYKHTVTVNSTDNAPYTIAIIYANEYDSSKLRDLGDALASSMIEYLDAYNATYGTSYTLNDMLFRGNGVEAFDDLDPGYYIAVAMGITSKGEVSGLYAVSATFHIDEETPNALYSSWIGDWTLIGDNGVSNDVVIGRKVANQSINMYGLQSLPFSVVGEYSVERNDIIFAAQVVEEGYQFSDGSVADIHLLGLDNEGKYYGLDNGNYGIAIAGLLENNRRAIVRYGLNQPDYPKFVAMMIVAYMNGKYYSLSEDIASFAGIAELAPAAATTGFTPMYLHFSKGNLVPSKNTLRIGERIDTCKMLF
jgi:hypothetical protein